MKRIILSSIATASLAFTAAPVTAQNEPEEARTTYTVEFLRFEPDKAETWTEMREKYWVPAAKAAGLPVPTVHWMMDGEWDLMVIREIPRGMASFDRHGSPEGERWNEEFLKLVGGEEAAAALRGKNGQLIEASASYFTHTHPD